MIKHIHLNDETFSCKIHDDWKWKPDSFSAEINSEYYYLWEINIIWYWNSEIEAVGHLIEKLENLQSTVNNTIIDLKWQNINFILTNEKNSKPTIWHLTFWNMYL